MGGEAPEAGEVRATHRAPTAANPRADSAPWLVARAGCDPLNLAEDADNLRWYREAELQVRACRGERAACARARACVGRLLSLGEPACSAARRARARPSSCRRCLGLDDAHADACGTRAYVQHARWAMLGAAGVLAQEIWNPDVFFYTAPTQIAQEDFLFPIAGVVAFQFLTMHWVEVRRWQDWKTPNSVNKDPIFDYSLGKHEVGYPGGVFDPLGVEKKGEEALQERKVMEIKHGRLAMLAWVGMLCEAQVTGVGPLEALAAHQADPMNTTVFSAVLSGGGWFHTSGPGCAIPPIAEFQGISIPTPCLPIYG